MGKTAQVDVLNGVDKKHPHVHGEDFVKLKTIGFIRETPPRAWGRRNGLEYVKAKDRNTPTCMGKTPISNRV